MISRRELLKAFGATVAAVPLIAAATVEAVPVVDVEPEYSDVFNAMDLILHNHGWNNRDVKFCEFNNFETRQTNTVNIFEPDDHLVTRMSKGAPEFSIFVAPGAFLINNVVRDGCMRKAYKYSVKLSDNETVRFEAVITHIHIGPEGTNMEFSIIGDPELYQNFFEASA